MAHASSLLLIGGLLFSGTALAAHLQHKPNAWTIYPEPTQQITPTLQNLTQDTVASENNFTLIQTVDREKVLESDGIIRMELSLQSKHPLTATQRKACDVIVVLDRSGSMNGEKMQWAKQALHELVQELQSEDRMSLLSFSSSAQSHIHLEDSNRQNWPQIINAISSGGGTNMSSAMQPALDLAEKSRNEGREARVIVLSDGEVNEGLQGELLFQEARRAINGEYVLSSVGIGAGFNESFMQQLSDAGTGNFHFIKQAGDLGEVFVHEFQDAAQQVANGLKLSCHIPDGVELIEAAGYPFTVNKNTNTATIHLGNLRASKKRSLWLTYRVVQPNEVTAIPQHQMNFKHNGAAMHLSVQDNRLLAIVKDQREAYAAIDKETWEKGVLTEAYNGLRQEIAQSVKKGNHAEAKKQIAEYRKRYEVANRIVKSEAIDQNLDELQILEAEVDECFAPSRAPAEKSAAQNIFSKDHAADNFKSRRGTK